MAYIPGDNTDNELTGTNLTDTIKGFGGADRLFGLEGGDTLDGGRGIDQMSGGLGNDTYYVDSTGDIVTELAGEGTDTIRARIDYTLPDEVEKLVLVNSLGLGGSGNEAANYIYGSSGGDKIFGLGGNDRLYGRAGDDTIDGGEGNDLIDGGSGTNKLTGGAGDDTYVVSDALLDTVIEDAAGGYDTVRTTAESYVLADNVERLILLGSVFEGTGNGLDNAIAGNADDNDLYGAGGADRITGKGGEDFLFGEDGNDTLFGNDDDDMLDGGIGDDRLDGGAGHDLLIGGEGTDRMRGGAGDDDFYFDNATSIGDVFDGGTGTDALALGINGEENTTFDLSGGRFTSIDLVAVDGIGNTVLLGGRLVATADFDGDTTPGQLAVLVSPVAEDTTIDASAVGSGGGQIGVVAFGPGKITLTGSANDDFASFGDGNDLAYGGAGSDALGGYAGNDELHGGDGDDDLYGGDGDDVVSGDAGNDYFAFVSGDVGHDIIQDFASGDLIDVEGLGYTSTADFASIVEADGNTVITIDVDTTITVAGVTGLTDSDFLFA
ncbi:calcium-binding protein [Oleomonas cavernae]|uniref:Calcium-binding protein n=1 Tax=Oleomonas cavernae TaxID=2320859 RepID=A0A418VU62_9PROT|nr:calcium-binding protein [Oleomonas cavernae]RJF80679.1 calcium-binding protein [Oleomonas cavernae]